MLQDQYVIQFKFLRFLGDWGVPAPVQAPQGVVYTAGEKSVLLVTVLLEPNQLETFSFEVPMHEKVGVSVPENLVFLPKVNTPTKLSSLDIFK